MSQKLAGKVAVVTGASKGIGAGIARHLAAEGATVVVNYASSKKDADAVVADIEANGGKAVALQADVSKRADVERLFAETKNRFDRLDVLVNNAGIFEVAPLAEITDEHFHRQFNLNVLGLLQTTQEAVKNFGKDGGSVVNISSVVATWSPANSAVYNATKAAVDAITRTLGKELAPRGIRVNSVNPGMVDTEGLRSSPFADARDATAESTPLGRIGKPADIAPAVVYFASSDSAWVTGETLYVTGGVR